MVRGEMMSAGGTGGWYTPLPGETSSLRVCSEKLGPDISRTARLRRRSLPNQVEVRSLEPYLRANRSKSAICEAISSRAASAAERIP